MATCWCTFFHPKRASITIWSASGAPARTSKFRPSEDPSLLHRTYQEGPENVTVRWLLCQHGEGLLAGEHETFVPGVLPRVAEPLVRAQNPGRGHVSLIREGRI